MFYNTVLKLIFYIRESYFPLGEEVAHLKFDYFMCSGPDLHFTGEMLTPYMP